jgi:signal transduction histidine kinase
MRGQVHRLRRLASDVRLAAQAQEHALDLHPEDVTVRDLVAGACTLYGPRFRDKGVSLHDECGDAVAVVHVDRDRLQQVLGNLLDNALRHTPAGGRVSLAWSYDGDRVAITVTDNGAGLAAADLEQIFERFHRLSDARDADGGGSGLGLTIARALAQSHGGDLTAHSAGPGTGSTFTVSLPLGR